LINEVQDVRRTILLDAVTVLIERGIYKDREALVYTALECLLSHRMILYYACERLSLRR